MLSPKQVAQAIGVSESSLKRWCDRGALPMVKTAGGHRKIPISSVLEFLRKTGHPLANPELLGLPPARRPTERLLEGAASQLREALLAHEEDVCRRILFDLTIAGHRLSAICDDVIQPVFQEIGDGWDCGAVEVYQERSACEITQRVLTELRLAWKQPDLARPLAIGGTPSGDHYRLPTAMVELVLLECGWHTVPLGTNLPMTTLRSALATHRPALLWLSVSHLDDEERFLREYPSLYETAQQVGSAIVIGGRALTEPLRRQISYAAYCDGMRHLESFVQSLSAVIQRSSPPVPDVPPVSE